MSQTEIIEGVEESTTWTLPAGNYWVGDPCYAFEDHSLWMRLLESADYMENPQILNAKADGHMFVASGTAYGDGVYTDQEGNEFPVDAGLIGVTPAREGEEVPFGTTVRRFTAPFTVSYDRGMINIGPLAIETGE
jgi:hypothetical protein